MLDAGRSLSTVLALGAVLVAILGYAVGSHSGSGRSTTGAHVAGAQLAAANVLLEAPSDWGSASSARQIPGLSLTSAVAFGPGSDAATTGLVSGSIPAGGATPLPASFVADLAAVPQVAVVELAQVEAFRYTNVKVRGFNERLTLFAVPAPGGQTTVLGCYAEAADAASMSTCEAIVASVRPVGQASSTSLAPSAAYASRLSELMRTLEARRDPLRAEMTADGSKQKPAGEMAEAFEAAAAGLTKLESPIATDQAQIDLSRALLGARDAYRALAAAQAPETYAAALTRVGLHEAGVTHALENFTLLGYGPG